jgi:hypothetical protein
MNRETFIRFPARAAIKAYSEPQAQPLPKPTLDETSPGQFCYGTLAGSLLYLVAIPILFVVMGIVGIVHQVRADRRREKNRDAINKRIKV